MKKTFRIILLLGIILVFGSPSHAEDSIPTVSKNTVYASVGNLVLWFTVYGNYERLLTSSDEKFFSRCYIHAGYGGYATWGSAGRTTVLSMQCLLGRKKSHLELGLGMASLFDKEGYNSAVQNAVYYSAKPSREDYRSFLPAATIGYRFQKPDEGFVFRTGIASPDGIYLSVGCAF